MQKKSNKSLVLNILAVVVGMLGLAYGSVPLYDLFCRTTGFGGTTQIAEILPDQILDKKITVRFNSDIERNLPWEFKPEQVAMDVKIGETNLAFYKAKNNGSEDITGTSIYNVTPSLAGAYFNKIQCFCFEKQLLKAGEEMQFPVSFFIDPAIIDDPNLKDINTITLSYTFFRVKDS